MWKRRKISGLRVEMEDDCRLLTLTRFGAPPWGICVDADGRARKSMRRIHRLRLRLRHWVHLRDLAVEVEVGWSPASDQPCASTERQILNCPLNENENATLER